MAGLRHHGISRRCCANRRRFLKLRYRTNSAGRSPRVERDKEKDTRDDQTINCRDCRAGAGRRPGHGSAGLGAAEDDKNRLHLDVQRPGRRDRQRHAQFVRARSRSSRPQARRAAGRGHLRGRRDQAGSRRAEDPKTDRIRQSRFHRRLYLVERAAGLAQAAGRLQDHDGRHQCGRLATRRRPVLALRVLDLVEQRPDAGRGRHST